MDVKLREPSVVLIVVQIMIMVITKRRVRATTPRALIALYTGCGAVILLHMRTRERGCRRTMNRCKRGVAKGPARSHVLTISSRGRPHCKCRLLSQAQKHSLYQFSLFLFSYVRYKMVYSKVDTEVD